METLQKAYGLGKKKFELHMKNMNGVPFELRGSTTGEYYSEEKGSGLFHMYNWMTSFVTGLAPLFYRTEKNFAYLKWANQFEGHYHAKIFETPLESMHDLGFLYSPYSIAMYQLTGDRHHRRDALYAADALAKRFDLRGRYIDAWGRMDDDARQGRAIIDCMMNLPLLLWAWKETGHTFCRDIALLHAGTTEKYFIRDDFSVAHSFLFDRATGEMTGEKNDCGYGNGSHWARGTAWAIYGFAVLARYSGDEAYRRLALRIAGAYFDAMPPNSYIPVWDFRLPFDKPAKFCGSGNTLTVWDEGDVNNCRLNVDTAAAAITTCGLLELHRQTGEPWLRETALSTLKALCQAPYLNADINVPGMLSHQNGQLHYTMYGDFFFVEALQTFLHNTQTCW